MLTLGSSSLCIGSSRFGVIDVADVRCDADWSEFESFGKDPETILAEMKSMIPPDAIEATRGMEERWRTLTTAMQDEAPSGARGELRVIGSGIGHADLTIIDEALLSKADHVFHCLYDRVTLAWIEKLRPDSFDLRILYDENVDRHDTYVCMAEAMLHHVRRGRKVLAVYYGHPGMFATPTHRAIRIARSEGHRASMRPGISALDHLVADVGFDPMVPGLLSYEASDLILHRRRLDPTLHTVLWQVGAVGEFQYSPAGFRNDGFDHLLDAIEAEYGTSAELVHYIAPQYVGIEPLCERTDVGALRSEDARRRIGALSTFYLPPSTVAALDAEGAASLGRPELASGGARIPYDLAAYGPGEMLALDRLKSFRAPAHYVATADSPAARFLMKLTRSPGLLEAFSQDPVGTMLQHAEPELSSRARRLLAVPNPQAFNAAIAEPPDHGPDRSPDSGHQPSAAPK